MKATTEKIRVKVNVAPKYKEVEVSFPYFTRNKGIYCKFFSRSAAICVFDYSFKKQIEYSDCGVPELWLTFDSITEEEFNAKLNEVMYVLIKKSNEKTI